MNPPSPYISKLNSGQYFDVIIVGARIAGATTGLLLAKKGYNVLVVDKTNFPSDTISSHVIWPPGVSLLKKFGLLESVLENSKCPLIY